MMTHLFLFTSFYIAQGVHNTIYPEPILMLLRRYLMPFQRSSVYKFLHEAAMKGHMEAYKYLGYETGQG